MEIQGLTQEQINNALPGDLLGYVLVTQSGKMIEDVVYPTITDAENHCHLGVRIARYVK